MEQRPQKRRTRWGEPENKRAESSREGDYFDPSKLKIGSTEPLPVSASAAEINGNINLLPLNLNFHLDIQRAREAAKIAIEKAKRAKEATAKLNEKKRETARKGGLFPKLLRFDEQGRAIDEEGNVVDIKPMPHVSLKINKVEDNVVRNQKGETIENEKEQEKETFKWIDPRIKTRKKKRSAFNFIEPGSLIEQESYANTKTSIETFQCDYDFKKMTLVKNKQSLKSPVTGPTILQTCTNNMGTSVDEKPTVTKMWEEDERYAVMEPWDAVLFSKSSSRNATYVKEKKKLVTKNLEKLKSPTKESSFNCNEEYLKINENLCQYNVFLLDNNELIIDDEVHIINMKKITKYIEHPVPLHVTKKEEVEPTYMYLTPAERKKLRKRKRQEKEKEKQDKIRIGLIPPPPPKLKLSNLIKVLGSTASALPSKIEMEVREQIRERELRHYQQNQQRKLKPEEKSQKKINKWKCDANAENEVAVIAIRNLSDKKHIFKIDMNAQQLHLTGVCFISGICNFLIVEGKHVSVERYKRLIFRRIKWGNDDEDISDVESRERSRQEYKNSFEGGYEDDIEDAASWSNQIMKGRNCELIWNGSVKKKSFPNWKILNVKKESEITDYLIEYDALHYYHVVRKYKEVQEGI